MKKSLAAATTTALVGLSALVLASPAGAATPIGDAVFYTTADLGTETGAGYPANDWFTGQLGGGLTAAGLTSSATGLNVAAGAGQAVQLLNNESTIVTDIPGFTDAVSDIEVFASDDSWVLQLPFFGETDGEFTTLRPAATGTTNPADAWITSRPITDGGGVTLFAAGASATLTELLEALSQGDAPELLAYGFWVGPDAAVSFYGVGAFDDLSIFTPVPTRLITPNPVTQTQATTTGVTFSGTGWFPGAEVYLEVYACDGESGTLGDSYAGDAVAGPDGTFSVTVVFDNAPAEGTYCVDFDDDATLYGSDVLATLENFVVSNVVIVANANAPALAASGAQESTPWMVAAGATVMLGAAAVALSARARRRTES